MLRAQPPCMRLRVILSCDIHAQAKKPRGPERWLNVALMVFYGIAGILAAIGSVHNIIVHADEYHSMR